MLKFWNEKKTEAICLFVAASFMFVAAVLWLRKQPEYVLSGDAREGSYEIPTLALPEEKKFRLQINPYPHLNLQTGKCNLMLENAEENQWDIYVLLRTEDTKETLYISPILKPGERIAYAEFDKIPDTEECAVVAEIYIMDPDKEEVAGGAEAGLLLTISEGNSVLH